MSKSLTLGSFFDGIGGWLLAAKHAGVNPVWASEIDDFPATVSAHHFPQVKQLGDITKINVDELEPVDIICAGSPCQDLSIAGKREGLAGERSGLFRTAVDIVRQMRVRTNGKYPRFFVWENVPGAFSSNHGRDFQAVLAEIGEAEIPMPESGRWADAGLVRTHACDIAWRVLDAQYWGVPQRRKRIFLVADFAEAGRRAAEILFEPESVPRDSSAGKGAREGAAAGAEGGAGAASEVTYGFTYKASANARTIGYEKETSPTIATDGKHGVLQCGLDDQGGGRMDVLTKTAPTMRAQAHNHLPVVHGATVYVSGGFASFDEKPVAGSVRAAGGDRGGGSENLVTQ